MGTPYLGEIKMVAWSFAASGWALANGQILAINQNQALFALYGTTYGGDGQQTFALPNIQSRSPMHMGQGANLSLRSEGTTGGSEATAVNTRPVPGSPDMPIQAYVYPSTAPVTTQSPYLVINFIIALQGVFPSQN